MARTTNEVRLTQQKRWLIFKKIKKLTILTEKPKSRTKISRTGKNKNICKNEVQDQTSST